MRHSMRKKIDPVRNFLFAAFDVYYLSDKRYKFISIEPILHAHMPPFHLYLRSLLENLPSHVIPNGAPVLSCPASSQSDHVA